MSQFAKRFHLIGAIFASFVFVLWSVLTFLVLFVWHTASPRLTFLAPLVFLGAVAVIEFKFFNDERKQRS